MDYDPVKDRLSAFFRRGRPLQRLFYAMLDLAFLRAWYVRRQIRATYPNLESRLDILDAGTGFGQWVHFLARTYRCATILGVDVKEDYLGMASDYFSSSGFAGRVRFEAMDLTRLSRSDEFDFILSVDVMEHILEDELVFSNFARALRPGGYVLINTPSDLGGSGIRHEGDKSFIGEHVRDGYNRQELGDKLRAAGLEVVRSEYSYGKAGSLAWRLLIKWPMLALGKTLWSIVLLPVYYIVAAPIGLLLNWVDMNGRNERGTGLVVMARKPAD